MINIIIGLAVLAWIFSRQLTVRPLKERSVIGWALLVIGIVEIGQFIPAHSVSGRDIAFLGGSAAIGCVLAVARAFTVRIWSTGTDVLRQGNIITAVLWLVSIGQHLLLEAFVNVSGLGQTSLLAYLGLVLLVQRAVLMIRARRYGHFQTR